MDLLTYVTDLARRRRLADDLKCSRGYLWQLATKWKGRQPSPDFAMEIELATRRLGPEPVTVQTLLPDAEWLLDEHGVVLGHLTRPARAEKAEAA